MDYNNQFTAVGLQGTAPIQAVPRRFTNGYWTIGGNASYSNSTGIYFGTIVSALPAAPSDFLIGQSVATSPVRGVAIWEPSIGQNDPFKNNYALQGTPVTVMTWGMFAINSWTKTATGAVDPSIDAVVIYNKTTGAIEFQPYGTVAAPTGWVLAVEGVAGVPYMRVVEVGNLAGNSPAVLNQGSGVVLKIEV